MDHRDRRRRTWYAVMAREPAQASSRESRRDLVWRLASAIGLVTAAEFVPFALMPGLRELLFVYLAYSLALLGALLVESLQDRRKDRAKSQISVAEIPSVDSIKEAEAHQEKRAA